MQNRLLAIFLFFSLSSAGQKEVRLTVPLGHKGPVANCYFSSDDRYIVSTDFNHALCIWDGEDGRQLYSLRDNLGSFTRSAFNNSTTYLTALTDSGKLYILDFPNLTLIKTFENVRDFSISPSGNNIFFIDGKAAIQQFDPVTGKLTDLKCHGAVQLKAASPNSVIVQQENGKISLLSGGNMQLLEGPGQLSLIDYDRVTNRVLVLKTNTKTKESLILCLDISTKKILHRLSLGLNVRNAGALFTVNKDHIICSYINSNEETAEVTITEPSVFSLKTGELLYSLKTPEVDLSALNLNNSRRRLVVVGDPSGPMYADTYIIPIDLANKDSFYLIHTNKKDLHFAVANKSSKRAVFDKDLLLPVIYTDGNMSEALNSEIIQYPDLKVDLAAKKGTDIPFIKGLLRSETAINDSVTFYTSALPGEYPDSSTGILVRKHQNTTDSFVFTYTKDYMVEPLEGCTRLFWRNGFTFYDLDITSLRLDSILLPQKINLYGLFQTGNNIIIEKDYNYGEGFSYKYSTIERKITDSTSLEFNGGLIRAYREADYSHESDGFPGISEIVFKDLDYTRNVEWEYPFRLSQDTIAVQDTVTGLDSYKVVRTVPFLRMKYVKEGKKITKDIGEILGDALVQQVRYWKDNKYAILTRANKLFIYSATTDSIEKSIPCSVGDWAALFVLPNSDILVSDKDRNETFLIKANRTENPQQLKGYFNPRLRQRPGLLLLQDASFGNYYIYSGNNYGYLCDITLFSATDYIVSTRQGLFDGTEKAMENIYFLVNIPSNKLKPWQTIDLKQLKAKYYIPGLFDKLVGGDLSDLPDVESIKSLSLAPDIMTEKSWSFNKPFIITLEDKGGGIGPVRVVINGKEVLADARKDKKQTGNSMVLAVDLKPFRKYFNYSRNTIQVFSSNIDSSLSSRGVIVSSVEKENKYGNPKLYVISIGTSDYKGQDIDLQYSSKDAIDMSTALEIGGSKLFGADSTIIFTISSLSADSNYWPSKKNIDRVFNEVAGKTSSKDIIVVYLSGHGISVGNDFYYLTKDAWSANASTYIYRELLTAVSISSSEFTEYLKKIPALKQLFIIDACASGKVVENLMAHRDIPVSTLKALDRMKDRTGTHVITGCAADAVSYEASRFGQGLLTYSLLEGMKGASLRENKFLDVSQWFQYARDRVPQLATGLGGIQTPQVCSPMNNESFDIAELDETEKKQVPLARERPVFIKSIFQEEEQFADIAGIAKAVDMALTEPNGKGTSPGFLYIPVDDFPGSFQVLGRYKITDGIITASIKVIETSGHKPVKSFTVTSASAKTIADNIAEKINDLK